MNYYRRISKDDQIENIDTVVEMLYIEGELVVDITKLVYFEDSFLSKLTRVIESEGVTQNILGNRCLLKKKIL